MAIYEYRCEDCGMKFEARRAMKDADAPIACPGCGGDHAARGLSTFFSARSGGSGEQLSRGGGGGGGCSSCSSHSCASCGGH
ncbi:MAG: zinc ribbon domain-containing protein [Chloroflexi bacterium]|nr:zinc ribbon domain-containing protein [Chloroflexota bacterium]